MSCSMTTIVRSAPIRLSSCTGLLALLGAHAGDRLVEEHHLGVLHEQHADLQPLLLAVREHAGRAVAQRASGRWSRAPARPARRPAAGAAASRQAPAVHAAGDVEVLQHAELARRRSRSGRSGRRRRGRSGATSARAGRGCRSGASPVPRTRPVSASTSVVLPAPFGPIRKCSSPSISVRSTPSTALKPSKSTVRSLDLQVVHAGSGASCRAPPSSTAARAGGDARPTSRGSRAEARPAGRNRITTMNSAPWK